MQKTGIDILLQYQDLGMYVPCKKAQTVKMMRNLLDLNVRSPKTKLDFTDISMQFLVRLDDVPQWR